MDRLDLLELVALGDPNLQLHTIAALQHQQDHASVEKLFQGLTLVEHDTSATFIAVACARALAHIAKQTNLVEKQKLIHLILKLIPVLKGKSIYGLIDLIVDLDSSSAISIPDILQHPLFHLIRQSPICITQVMNKVLYCNNLKYRSLMTEYLLKALILSSEFSAGDFSSQWPYLLANTLSIENVTYWDSLLRMIRMFWTPISGSSQIELFYPLYVRALINLYSSELCIAEKMTHVLIVTFDMLFDESNRGNYNNELFDLCFHLILHPECSYVAGSIVIGLIFSLTKSSSSSDIFELQKSILNLLIIILKDVREEKIHLGCSIEIVRSSLQMPCTSLLTSALSIVKVQSSQLLKIAADLSEKKRQKIQYVDVIPTSCVRINLFNSIMLHLEKVIASGSEAGTIYLQMLRSQSSPLNEDYVLFELCSLISHRDCNSNLKVNIFKENLQSLVKDQYLRLKLFAFLIFHLNDELDAVVSAHILESYSQIFAKDDNWKLLTFSVLPAVIALLFSFLNQPVVGPIALKIICQIYSLTMHAHRHQLWEKMRSHILSTISSCNAAYDTLEKRISCAFCLREFCRHFPEEGTELIPFIQDFLHDEDWSVRTMALDCILSLIQQYYLDVGVCIQVLDSQLLLPAPSSLSVLGNMNFPSPMFLRTAVRLFSSWSEDWDDLDDLETQLVQSVVLRLWEIALSTTMKTISDVESRRIAFLGLARYLESSLIYLASSAKIPVSLPFPIIFFQSVHTIQSLIGSLNNIESKSLCEGVASVLCWILVDEIFIESRQLGLKRMRIKEPNSDEKVDDDVEISHSPTFESVIESIILQTQLLEPFVACVRPLLRHGLACSFLMCFRDATSMKDLTSFLPEVLKAVNIIPLSENWDQIGIYLKSWRSYSETLLDSMIRLIAQKESIPITGEHIEQALTKTIDIINKYGSEGIVHVDANIIILKVFVIAAYSRRTQNYSPMIDELSRLNEVVKESHSSLTIVSFYILGLALATANLHPTDEDHIELSVFHCLDMLRGGNISNENCFMLCIGLGLIVDSFTVYQNAQDESITTMLGKEIVQDLMMTFCRDQLDSVSLFEPHRIFKESFNKISLKSCDSLKLNSIHLGISLCLRWICDLSEVDYLKNLQLLFNQQQLHCSSRLIVKALLDVQMSNLGLQSNNETLNTVDELLDSLVDLDLSIEDRFGYGCAAGILLNNNLVSIRGIQIEAMSFLQKMYDLSNERLDDGLILGLSIALGSGYFDLNPDKGCNNFLPVFSNSSYDLSLVLNILRQIDTSTSISNAKTACHAAMAFGALSFKIRDLKNAKSSLDTLAKSKRQILTDELTAILESYQEQNSGVVLTSIYAIVQYYERLSQILTLLPQTRRQRFVIPVNATSLSNLVEGVGNFPTCVRIEGLKLVLYTLHELQGQRARYEDAEVYTHMLSRIIVPEFLEKQYFGLQEAIFTSLPQIVELFAMSRLESFLSDLSQYIGRMIYSGLPDSGKNIVVSFLLSLAAIQKQLLNSQKVENIESIIGELELVPLRYCCTEILQNISLDIFLNETQFASRIIGSIALCIENASPLPKADLEQLLPLLRNESREKSFKSVNIVWKLVERGILRPAYLYRCLKVIIHQWSFNCDGIDLMIMLKMIFEMSNVMSKVLNDCRVSTVCQVFDYLLLRDDPLVCLSLIGCLCSFWIDPMGVVLIQYRLQTSSIPQEEVLELFDGILGTLPSYLSMILSEGDHNVIAKLLQRLLQLINSCNSPRCCSILASCLIESGALVPVDTSAQCFGEVVNSRLLDYV